MWDKTLAKGMLIQNRNAATEKKSDNKVNFNPRLLLQYGASSFKLKLKHHISHITEDEYIHE